MSFFIDFFFFFFIEVKAHSVKCMKCFNPKCTVCLIFTYAYNLENTCHTKIQNTPLSTRVIKMFSRTKFFYLMDFIYFSITIRELMDSTLTKAVKANE